LGAIKEKSAFSHTNHALLVTPLVSLLVFLHQQAVNSSFFVPSEKGGDPHPRTLASTANHHGTGENIAPSSTLLFNEVTQDQPVNDKYEEFDVLLCESQSIWENSNHDIISEHQVYLHNLESS
jgi:hypothetical protein